jgi:cytoskeletal protein CcmA (bactofilin family)
MSKNIKFLSILAVLTMLALTLVTPARAFDSRTGDTVIIAKGEVINDDLYVTATTIVLDGTVKGDLVAFGQTITVNGVVEGDLITAGQTITVNGVVEGDLMAAGQAVIITGEVKDDARIAGAALQFGSTGVIGDDLVAAGASLEMQKGSQVGGDLVVGSGQVLVAGDVAEDVTAGTAALELRGSVGGNVQAYVDVTGNTQGAPMDMYMAQSPISIPRVSAGLTIANSAKIAGNLEYTSTIDLPIPSGVVGGKITRTEPKVNPATVAVQPTNSQRVGTWALDMLRDMLTFILFGLLIGWLFPKLKQALPEIIRGKPWASLGWGLVAWAAFFFALLLIPFVVILLGIFFGAFTLVGLSGTIIWIGILASFALVTGFALAAAYLTKVVVGEMLGKWILQRTNPDLAGHKLWPMILGVVMLVLVIGILRFPLLPIGFIGWMANFAVILCGLGALWIWGRERLAKPVISNQ